MSAFDSAEIAAIRKLVTTNSMPTKPKNSTSLTFEPSADSNKNDSKEQTVSGNTEGPVDLSAQIRLLGVLGVTKTKVAPGLWMHDGQLKESTTAAIQQWHDKIRKAAFTPETAAEVIQSMASIVSVECDSSQEMDASGGPPATLDDAVIGLGAVWCLDACQRFLSAEEMEAHVESLWTIAARAEATNSTASAEALLTKSIGIEVAATLCLVMERPDEATDRYLAEELESIVEGQLDGDGWPAARLLDDFGMLAASWCRCYLMLKKQGIEFDFEVVMQIEWLVRQLLRMRRPNKSLCFAAADNVMPGAKSFWKMVLSVSQDADDARLSRTGNSNKLASKKRSKAGSKRVEKITPKQAAAIADPFNISEWGGAALLRSTWAPTSPKLAVDFSNSAGAAELHPKCRIDLGRREQLLLGDAMPVIHFDEQLATPEVGFEVVCDRSDQDLDYLELQVDVGNGGSLSRQFVLSRGDEFLLVIDTVLPPQRQTTTGIDYECQFPLAAGIEGLHEQETREVYLQTNEFPRTIESLMLPLVLPEWNAEKFNGSLTVQRDKILLTRQTQGVGMCVPVVFDLNAKRSRKKRTWRQLNVAQNRKTVPAEHGVAFRFQLNKSQWFFYRAVATMGNRTFMGENTNAEFVLNKFESGAVSELIEVK